jgi:hypothetical protein
VYAVFIPPMSGSQRGCYAKTAIESGVVGDGRGSSLHSPPASCRRAPNRTNIDAADEQRARLAKGSFRRSFPFTRTVVPAALLVLVLHVLTKSARVGSSRIVIESEGF